MTDNGALAKATWVSLHDEVRLEQQDGTVSEGWTYGPDWWGTDNGWIACLEVEREGSPTVVVEMEDVRTITPLSAIHSGTDLLAKVTDLLRGVEAMADREEHSLRMLLGEHTTIEVTVRRDDHPCKPGRLPRRTLPGR